MHILIFNWRDPNNPRSGGAEYVTMMHAKTWVKKGDVVTWFTASFGGAIEEEFVDGVRIIRRGNPVTVFIHAGVYYLFYRKRIDLIVDEVHGIPFFAVLYCRKPIVLFVHEVAGKIWDVMYHPPISWFGRAIERMWLYVYRNHYVWTDALSTRDELIRLGIRPSCCVAIPCPSSKRSLARAPVKEKVPTFIFVGRLVRMKRIDHILAAFGEIRKNIPNASLRIVGDARPPSLRSGVSGRGKHVHADGVTWYGRVSEKRKFELLQSAHILLHASVKEGWGLVVLEAASQWTPSVVYGVSGLVDTVQDGKTGVVVDEDPKHLADAAVSLITDTDRYRTMQKAAADYNMVFTWDSVVKKSRAILQSAYEKNI